MTAILHPPANFAPLELEPQAPALPEARVAVNPLIRMALYLFVLSIPFEMPDRTIPIEIPNLTGIIFILSTMLQPSVCYRKVPGALLCFGLYLWVFLISVVVNGVDLALPGNLFITFLLVGLILWAAMNVMADQRAMRTVLLVLVAACTLRAGIQVLGIGTKTYNVYTGGQRITALGQNLNLSAIIFSAGLVTLVGLRLQNAARRVWVHLIAWPIAALIAYAAIQTGSRGGLLCSFTGLLIYTMRGRDLPQRVRNVAIGLVAVGVLAVAAWNTPMMRARFEASAEEGRLAGREHIYPALFGMIRERPIIGWGPVANQYEVAVRMQDPHGVRRDAHNLVLELLTSTGIVGMLPFLAGLALCWRAAWRSRHGPLGLLPAAVLAAVLTGTISGTWIASKILWLAMAIALAAGRHWMPVPAAAVNSIGRTRAVEREGE